MRTTDDAIDGLVRKMFLGKRDDIYDSGVSASRDDHEPLGGYQLPGTSPYRKTARRLPLKVSHSGSGSSAFVSDQGRALKVMEAAASITHGQCA